MARRLSADSAAAAESVLRLAVLLQAGVTPARAWSHLASAGDTAARMVVAAADSGLPLTAAIALAGRGERPADERRRGRAPRAPSAGTTGQWRDIAAAWEVATTVGAPLAESLRGLAATLRDAQEAADDVRVALAEPAATARLMGWLPLVAVLLGVALGFDTLATLATDPIGIGCLVAGAVLILCGRRWTAALVARARVDGRLPGLDAELLAIALSGGVSIDRARAVVAAARAGAATAMATATADGSATPARGSADAPPPETDSPPSTGASGGVDSADGAVQQTDAVLELSRSAGVPAVELLRASSALARHRARIDGRLRAARLSSRLLLPLGVCTLPAFLLLGVAPMLLSVMTAVPLQL